MPEDRPEVEKKPRIIEVNEWFNPQLRPEVGDFKFVVAELGTFEISTFWDDRRNDISESVKGLIVDLSPQEKIISYPEAPKYERAHKTKLFEIDVICREEKFRGTNLPFRIELKLPNGRVFANNFKADNPALPIAGTNDWKENGQEERILLIPADKNIFENIQVRIMPTD